MKRWNEKANLIVGRGKNISEFTEEALIKHGEQVMVFYFGQN